MTRKGFYTGSKVRITSQNSTIRYGSGPISRRSQFRPLSCNDHARLNLTAYCQTLYRSFTAKLTIHFTLQVFKANNDSDSVVTNTLEVPILARFVRINPLAWNQLGSICLRLELYGCQTNQGNKKNHEYNVNATKKVKKLTEKEKKKTVEKELSESCIMIGALTLERLSKRGCLVLSCKLSWAKDYIRKMI